VHIAAREAAGVAGTTDDAIDELYAAPLDEFVARRDQLARELRTTDRDAAREVKQLRKPSRAAWAVNHAARESPDLLDALLAAGRALRDAQQRALRGGGGASLHDATRARQHAVAALADVAVAALGATGESARDAIEQTLTAASIDDDAAAEVRAARLVEELEPPDIFATLDAAPSRAGSRPAKPARERATATTRPERTRTRNPEPEPPSRPTKTRPDRAKQLDAEARRARAEADAAQRAHDAAVKRADALAQKAHDAVAAADDARRAVRDAAHRAREQRRQAEQAERRARAARAGDEPDR
jgi:hypothetical protein